MNKEFETKITNFYIIEMIHDTKAVCGRSTNVVGIVSNQEWLVLYE